ncbi:protein of unknown function (DUF4773) [Popillia japonica]|uniref:DUF4773 domain-containing protein n=1 Tax=Popillia japonica TaxID=7064 RepID=A0AAW1NJ98_POPJA
MFGKVILLGFFLLFNLSDTRAANILEKREETVVETDVQKSACTCDGPSCNCCVDFNITYIDLGGPGCVHMKYISQNEGITVNISYGDNQLHSEEVKGPNPQPTCMTLLAKFAEICARFAILEPYQDGLKGCVLLEPKLLGDAQTQFDIGCFLMGNDGMKIDPNGNSTLNMILDNVNRIENNEKNPNESSAFTEEELIAVVNESAEKSLVFFGNLLGLTFDKIETEAEDETAENTTS